MASDDEFSVLSAAPTTHTTPSAVSSAVPAQRTRHVQQRRGIVPPKPKPQSQSTLANHFARPPRRPSNLSPLANSTQQSSLVQIPINTQSTTDREAQHRPDELEGHEDEDMGEDELEYASGIRNTPHPGGDESSTPATTPLQTPLGASTPDPQKQQKPRPLTSHIYKFCKIQEIQSKKYMVCNNCSKRYAWSGSTSGMRSHWRTSHGVDIDTADDSQKRKREEEDIALALTRSFKLADVETRKKSRRILEDITSKEHLIFLYIKWIVTSDISFYQVQHEDFRAFLHYVSPVADDYLPNSHTTIQKRVMALFEEGQQRVVQYLSKAISDIHITCDGWTSPSNKALFAVLAHFTDEDGRLQSIMLGMKEVEGAHTGENYASIILPILETYQLRNRLGYFVMDNDSRNDTMIRTIAEDLQADGIFYDSEQRRLRCNGHVINIAVQAFLFGKPSKDLDYLEDVLDIEALPSQAEVNKWRTMGPLGKLHNIVVFIYASPQRLQRFSALSNGLKPRRDNKTRWNSWFEMLDWSLTRIRQAIIAFIAEEPELEDDRLSFFDWRDLEHISKFLKNFRDATEVTEGRTALIERVLLSMEFLCNCFEHAIIEHRNNDFMAVCLDAGYTKILEYFNKKSRTPAYIAAVVLNPSHKWRLFSNWEEADKKEADVVLRRLWQEEYCKSTGLPTYSAPSKETSNEFFKWMSQKETQLDDTKDELQRYLDEGITHLGESSALEWWLSTANRTKYPLLSRMAIDILSIPAMSSEAERVFSSAKLSVQQTRLRLQPTTIEGLECLKSWFRLEIFNNEELQAVIGGIEGL